jgi:hypothetical protein
MTSTQRVVAGFFIGVLLLLIGVRFVAADTLREELGVDESVVPVFIAAISVLIAVVLVGVVRRWRWVFWLVLLASLGGLFRVPASALELAGVIATALPAWYVLLQGAIGAVQVIVAVVMIRGYRRAGAWG